VPISDRKSRARRLAARALLARLGGEAPAVLIGDLNLPPHKFTTPHSAVNRHAGNAGRNNARHRFDHGNPVACRRHAGKPREFERLRRIIPTQAIATLKRIPRPVERATAMQAAEAAKEARP
jgi:endonuclease/exonuclease/phosphatase family metal-dependent hydrolase